MPPSSSETDAVGRMRTSRRLGHSSMPPDSGFEGIAHRYLSLARAAIGMDMAWLSEHSATGQVVRAVDGASGLMSLADGSVVPCDCAFRSGHPRARATTIVGDVRSHTFISHAPAAWRVAGAYASTPVHLADGRVFGSLTCVSANARTDVGDGDARLIVALGDEITVLAARAEVREARGPLALRCLAGAARSVVRGRCLARSRPSTGAHCDSSRTEPARATAG